MRVSLRDSVQLPLVSGPGIGLPVPRHLGLIDGPDDGGLRSASAMIGGGRDNLVFTDMP